MGCDIHCYSEVRKYRYDDKEKVDGVWISDDKWTVNPHFYLYNDEQKMWVDLDDRVIGYRWYALFAVLADVRNEWSIEPVSRPKGLPLDTCEQIKAESDRYDGDGHSHSWLSLRELEEHPLNHWAPEPPLSLQQEWERILGVMREKCKKHRADTSDVRVVFFFDN